MFRLILLVLTLVAGCRGGSNTRESALPELPPPVTSGVRPRGELRPARDLVIALTGELRGEIEPCGCPTLPYGGFARRATLLERLRDPRVPLFQLDAGEALLKGLRTDGREDADDRAALVLELMIDLGVDVMAPGPTDLRVAGLDRLRALPERGLRLTSATWLDEAGDLVFPPAVVVQRGGVRLGVIGLSAPTQELKSRDPVLAASEALAGLPNDLTLVVALSNLGEAERARVAAEVPGIAAVLSTMGESYDRPGGDGALRIEVGDRGRYVTLVRVRAASAPGMSLDPQAERALRDLDTLRAQLDRRVRAGESAEDLEARLRDAEAALATLGDGRNLVEVSERPLGTDLDAPGPMDAPIAAFKLRQEGAARARVQETDAAGWQPHYGTSGSCVRCHSLQFARWTYTSHAKATNTLIERGRQKDVECVGCHTTGFGQPGGFAETDPATLRTFGAVQCEACHGPLDGHPRDARAQPRPVGEDTCRGCHDAANSPNFDYASYLPRVACPRDERAGVTTPPGSDPPLPAP